MASQSPLAAAWPATAPHSDSVQQQQQLVHAPLCGRTPQHSRRARATGPNTTQQAALLGRHVTPPSALAAWPCDLCPLDVCLYCQPAWRKTTAEENSRKCHASPQAPQHVYTGHPAAARGCCVAPGGVPRPQAQHSPSALQEQHARCDHGCRRCCCRRMRNRHNSSTKKNKPTARRSQAGKHGALPYGGHTYPPARIPIPAAAAPKCLLLQCCCPLSTTATHRPVTTHPPTHHD